MSYEDLKKAKAERAGKNNAKEAKRVADVGRGSYHKQEDTWLEVQTSCSSRCARAKGHGAARERGIEADGARNGLRQ